MRKLLIAALALLAFNALAANQQFGAVGAAGVTPYKVSTAACLTPCGIDVIYFDQVAASMTVGASDVVFSAFIDLQKYPNVKRITVQKFGLASAGETLGINSSIDGVTALFALPSTTSLNTNSASAASAANMMSGPASPASRYIQVQYVNGATIQTALKLLLILDSN